MLTQLPLSHLHAGRRNPRRVAPDRHARRRLIASIRTYGLLEPLVVRPTGDERYEVIAGKQRLRALRSIHRRSDPDVACHVTDVDAETADGMALSENFARQQMHPLDEAEAFAKLARVEAQGVDAIASAFGMRPTYVRQRMKLAGLAEPIKAACRNGEVDLATAETYASVPQEQQVAVWKELGGQAGDHRRVRALIANAWIEAGHALFDVEDLPDEAVSTDLFTTEVLIERSVFMAAQAEALQKERAQLLEDGWAEVVVAERADVYDRLLKMDNAPDEFDDRTEAALRELSQQRDDLEQRYDTMDEDDREAAEALCEQIDAVEERERELIESSPRVFTEAVKAIGTVFLMLMPDGHVSRAYRVPKHSRRAGAGSGGAQAPLTCANLTDAQQAEINVHRTLAVRLAVHDNPLVLKRLLVLALHPNIRRDAIRLRLEQDATETYMISNKCPAPNRWSQRQGMWAAIDPFSDEFGLDESEAYDRLCECTGEQLDAVIGVLIGQRIECNLNRTTPLADRLIGDLGVNLRDVWLPSAEWLKGYRKLQLAQLRGWLRGDAYYEPGLRMKKSELLDEACKLFADAGSGSIADSDLAARVQGWLPPAPTVAAESEADGGE